MAETMTILLNELRFFAFHGLYPEEKILGNEFMVDVEVTYYPDKGTITGISDTINYASVFELVKKQMEIPTGLMETLAMDIANSIHHHFPHISSISIQIRKMHPPMADLEGNAGVRYQRSF